MYKRILLKISGEQLAGEAGHGIDPNFIKWLASEIKKAIPTGVQIVIVVGGGNWIRGANYAGGGIEPSTAHYMGMLATTINGLALMDIIENEGMPVRLQSSLQMHQVAEPFIRRRAIRHMEKGRVVIVAGGTGKPYMTTDTAAINIGLELGCDVILKATKVDGIYDVDPMKSSKATKFQSLTHQEALEQPNIQVMDKAALGMAADNNIPIIIFKLEDDSIKRVIAGDTSVGTKVESNVA